MSTSTPSAVSVVNRQFHLAAVPKGMPKESDFRIAETRVLSPGMGEILVRTAFWSVDPYMRGRITGVRTYADPVLVGDLMVGGAVGQVVQSNDETLRPGDFVAGYWGWQEWAVSKAKRVQKLDASVAPVSTALGILGMPGMTAYFGFLDICKPKPGETVVVSGAAGAVGSYVCQIAKINGCRAIGTAGTDAKIDYLRDELGLDGTFNYKTTTDYTQELKKLCPNGIDCYFDNTGGSVSDAVFPLLNTFARVSVCGQIAHYNAQSPELGPRLLSLILVKQLRVEGFIVSRFAERFPEGVAQMARWLKEGRLHYREHVVDGFEQLPNALIALLNGANTGKMVVTAGWMTSAK
ncbi:MAG: NADP-dependent oxidoreductase [Bryobacteraceae bacterium]